MIEVRELRKTYLSPVPVVAVDGLSFEVRPGEVFGLLGPNGAGKTTALRMLATLIRPDGGSATIAGHDLLRDAAGVRRSIGYLSGSTGLYGRLTARELLVYFGRLQGVGNPAARAEALIERFALGPYADQRCERLSAGNKQKVSIARAVVHEPPVLILDEPTVGLDVLVARTFLAFVAEMRAAGRAVVYSSHVMSEAERLCDRIAVIHQGRVLACGALAELRAHTGEEALEAVFVNLVEAAR